MDRSLPRVRRFGAALAAGFLLSCSLPSPRPLYRPDLPAPAREFRGVWVATVANIDWPSAPGIPSPTQQAEALAILERCRALNFNAVILQIRPQCDVIYPSALEPWSFFLSGEQGLPPQPIYDPLSFWIDEAHARGLELHAWINPFRANHPGHRGKLSPRSIVSRRPDLALRLGGKGYYWLDPGRPEARAHTMAVIREVVEHYDVDGIHLDDYFYPYPSYNDGADFPDGDSWAAYRDSGGSLSRSDWRRGNVDDFVRDLYREVKQRRPEVKVGISPFGIWRPGHPPGTEVGVDQYETLFADPRLWLRQGWLDYCAPQLYWRVASETRSFPALLSWWLENNLQGRHIWPGLYTSRVSQGKWPAREVVDQIALARDILESNGHLHFSMRAIQAGNDPSRQLTTSIGARIYAQPALVPRSSWLDSTPPPPPEVAPMVRNGSRVELSWKQPAGEDPFLYVVYSKAGTSWTYDILPGTRTGHELDSRGLSWSGPGRAERREFAVSAVDRLGNESNPVMVACPSQAIRRAVGAPAPQRRWD